MPVFPALTRAKSTLVILGIVFLAGCGAGQQSQTAGHVTATGGAGGQAGAIALRDAQIVHDGPIPGDEVYKRGEDARLQFTVVNEGDDADRLVAVTSPVAGSAVISGDTVVPGHHVLTAGYDDPVAAVTLPDTAAITVTLTDVQTPIRAGLTYPAVFRFERAGELRVELPVGNPAQLPPRAE